MGNQPKYTTPLASDSRLLLRAICLGTGDMDGLIAVFRREYGEDTRPSTVEALLGFMERASLIKKVGDACYGPTEYAWRRVRIPPPVTPGDETDL